MSRRFNLTPEKATPGRVKPKAHRPTQAEIEAAYKKNWGDDAYKTIMKFRRIWDKQGVKLAP